jgi:hypothetical protein
MKHRNYALMGMFFILFSSCNTEINIYAHFNKNASFTIRAKTFNDSIQGFQITDAEVSLKDKVHASFVDWLNNNSQGWKETIPSYQARTAVYQSGFTLSYLISADAAVIQFKDKQNKLHQYIKSIAKGELDFLNDAIK